MTADETSVFASAAPVTAAEVQEDGKKDNTKPSVGTEDKEPAAQKRAAKSSGSPAWHLSLTLGLVIALVGGVALWMVSPILAIIVVAGIIVLMGVALALRHLFGRKARENSSQSTGNQVSPKQSHSQTRSQNRRDSSQPQSHSRQDRSQRESRRRQRRENGPESESGHESRGLSRFSRRNKRRHGENDHESARENGREPRTRAERRQQRRDDRARQRQQNHENGPSDGRSRSRSRNSGGTTNGSGSDAPGRRQRRDRRHDDSMSVLGGSHSGIPDRPTRRKPKDVIEGACVNPGLQDKNTPPKNKNTTDKTVTPDTTVKPGSTPAHTTPQGKKTPWWKSRKTKSKTEKYVSHSGTLNVPSKTASPPKKDVIDWPNVDLDHHKPLPAHQIPRITIPKKAVRVPRHHGKEPQWPSVDHDSPSWPTMDHDVPPQRDKRGTMTTPDLLTREQREQRLHKASSVALKLADDKDTQAHQFLQLAGDLDGVQGMEQTREEHLLDAAKAAHDGQVRRHMAKIYEWLTQN